MESRPPRAPESVARPAARLAAATLCSRVLGLLREAVFAALFATRPVADAFVFAFRIPNLLRDFFAEGALSAAFVPTVSQARAAGGDARAFALARRVLGTLAVVTGTIALLGIVFAPAVVDVVAPDAPAATRALTVTLTRIMFPFLPLVALAAAAMGVLNAYGRFFLPALAPAFFNLAAVLGGLGLLALGAGAEDAVHGWAALVLVGGALQLLVQVPALRGLGLRGWPQPDLRFADPGLRTVARRMAPVLLSLAATNLMLLVTTALASRTEGWASALNYAFRLVHLPIGLVGVALGTVVLAAGARRHAGGDGAGARTAVGRGLELNAALSLPAAVGLAVLAEPIVRLVYERGRFGAASTAAVAEALVAYAAGLVCYSGVKAAAPAFLARGDTQTPMRCALFGLGLNLGAALAFTPRLGLTALAGAVAVGAAGNYAALRVVGVRRGLMPGPDPRAALRLLLAAGALAGLLLGLKPWWIGDAGGWGGGARTLALVLLGGGAWLALGRILRLPGLAGRGR